MEKLYSTDEVLNNVRKLVAKIDVARWLVGVGWTIQCANIYDDGRCAEVTLSHPLYDSVVDVSANNETSTEYLIRSIFAEEIAETLIAESKEIWTVVEDYKGREAA